MHLVAIWVLITQSYGSRATVAGFCQVCWFSIYTVNFYLLQQTVASVLRSLAPGISNMLFSLSIDKGYLGGYMVYFVFVCSAVMALCASSLLPGSGIALNQKENSGSIEFQT